MLRVADSPRPENLQSFAVWIAKRLRSCWLPWMRRLLFAISVPLKENIRKSSAGGLLFGRELLMLGENRRPRLILAQRHRIKRGLLFSPLRFPSFRRQSWTRTDQRTNPPRAKKRSLLSKRVLHRPVWPASMGMVRLSQAAFFIDAGLSYGW